MLAAGSIFVQTGGIKGVPLSGIHDMAKVTLPIRQSADVTGVVPTRGSIRIAIHMAPSVRSSSACIAQHVCLITGGFGRRGNSPSLSFPDSPLWNRVFWLNLRQFAQLGCPPADQVEFRFKPVSHRRSIASSAPLDNLECATADLFDQRFPRGGATLFRFIAV